MAAPLYQAIKPLFLRIHGHGKNVRYGNACQTQRTNTRLASDHVGESIGGFVVEATAALSIFLYLPVGPKVDAEGILFDSDGRLCRRRHDRIFVLFQRGGPLSAVPVIFAVGVAMMAIAGILFFREPAFWQRLAGIIWQ